MPLPPSPSCDNGRARRARAATAERTGSPVHVMQPQPLREKDAGGETGRVHAASLRFLSRKATARRGPADAGGQVVGRGPRLRGDGDGEMPSSTDALAPALAVTSVVNVR